MIPPLWLANILGWIVAHKRAILGVLLACVVFFSVVMVYRGCTATPTLTEPEIQAGEKAKKDQNDAELRRIIVESDVKSKQIDANVANAELETMKAREDSREKWANANISELQAEFDRRKGQ